MHADPPSDSSIHSHPNRFAPSRDSSPSSFDAAIINNSSSSWRNDPHENHTAPDHTDFSVHVANNDVQSYFNALTLAAANRLETEFSYRQAMPTEQNTSLQPLISAIPPLSKPHYPLREDLNLRAKITMPNGDGYLTVICPFDERVHYTPKLDIAHYSSLQLSESENVFSKEFAELSMVCRVLSMALDPSVPLLDRFKFICIVSHYIDEHFAKRLGYIPKLDLNDLQTATMNLRRQVRPKTSYEEHLTSALRLVIEKQHQCLTRELLPKLKEKGVQIVPVSNLTEEEAATITSYFKEHLRPTLTPILLGPAHPFPLIRSHDIYIYVTVYNPKKGAKKTIIFRVPSNKRLIPIEDSGLRFVTSEDVCLSNLNIICHSLVVLNAHVFRVTRNTKISIDDDNLDDVTNLLDFIIDEVHRRRQAPVTRLEVLDTAPKEMVDNLVNKLYLDDMDVYYVSSPLLDLSSCMALAFVPLPWLRQVMRDPVVPTPFKGLTNRLIADPGAIFGVIRKQDVLVEYPRDNFENSAVLYLHAAARDPRVRSIKSVIYRGGGESPIVAALIRAAKNGKEVTVVIELKASFDEVQNSEYAKALQIVGCNVTYGVMGLKVHSKIMLVVREECNGKLCSYVNVSTGNFNPSTAKLYTDYSLFTCDKDICTDVLDVFNSLTGYSFKKDYRSLLVAPMNMLERFIELIREEAANARAGKPARIACQMNGLSDKQLTKELYDASQAGVRIDLIVRGSCRLRPGIPGMSDNIHVYSWVGQILQHRRLYYFHAKGEGKYFIGSADWRTRNLTGRVEVIVPITDRVICKRLSKAFDLIKDGKWVWRMSPDGRYYKGFPVTTSPPVSASIAPVIPGLEPAKAEKRHSDSDDDEREEGQFEEPKHETASNHQTLIETMAGVQTNVQKQEGINTCTRTSETMKGGKRGKTRRRHVVNIQGNTKTVDKVAVGAVPVRFVDRDGGELEDCLEVLMVARGENDPWAVPKGGQNEGETQLQATVRIAREKAGVSSHEVIANLGWIEVTKGHKQIAFQTVVLLAKELGTVVGSDRRRRWMGIAEARQYSKGEHGHEFTEKALELVVGAVKMRFEEGWTGVTLSSRSGDGSVSSMQSGVTPGRGTPTMPAMLEKGSRDHDHMQEGPS